MDQTPQNPPVILAFEKLLYELAASTKNLQFGTTDLDRVQHMAPAGPPNSIANFPLEQIKDFVKTTDRSTTYLYYTRSQRLNRIDPPSFSDFRNHVNLQYPEIPMGKKIVTRLIDQYGVWQYGAKWMGPVSRELDDEIKAAVQGNIHLSALEQAQILYPIFEAAATDVQYRLLID